MFPSRSVTHQLWRVTPEPNFRACLTNVVDIFDRLDLKHALAVREGHLDLVTNVDLAVEDLDADEGAR